MSSLVHLTSHLARTFSGKEEALSFRWHPRCWFSMTIREASWWHLYGSQFHAVSECRISSKCFLFRNSQCILQTFPAENQRKAIYRLLFFSGFAEKFHPLLLKFIGQHLWRIWRKAQIPIHFLIGIHLTSDDTIACYHHNCCIHTLLRIQKA